jgi:hypothetical protein
MAPRFGNHHEALARNPEELKLSKVEMKSNRRRRYTNTRREEETFSKDQKPVEPPQRIANATQQEPIEVHPRGRLSRTPNRRRNLANAAIDSDTSGNSGASRSVYFRSTNLSCRVDFTDRARSALDRSNEKYVW